MSSAARWANTAKATLWPATSGAAWDGSASFGDPVVIDCDYSSEAKVMVDANGEQFTSALSVFTEHAAGKFGDMLAIGDHSSSPTPTAGARAVRAVKRDADTFAREADDFTLITA
jgi:hypothetical protein